MKRRSSGVLMHISSLPSDYGIGTMGAQAYRFVDFLKEAGQSYWQVLPICPPDNFETLVFRYFLSPTFSIIASTRLFAVFRKDLRP